MKSGYTNNECPIIDKMKAMWSAREPYIWHDATDDRLVSEILAEIPNDIDEIRTLYNGRIKVFSENPLINRKVFSASEASSFWKDGHTLYLLDFHEVDEKLRTSIGTLSSQHGIEHAIISLFVSFPGASMPAHWDAVNNLTIQIAGRKQWWLHENVGCENPDFNYAPEITIADKNIRRKISEDFDFSPSKMNSIELTQNSAIFLPRGVLHRTQTSVPSISLSVTIKPKYLYELLAENMAYLLSNDSKFRVDIQQYNFMAGEIDTINQLMEKLTEISESLRSVK